MGINWKEKQKTVLAALKKAGQQAYIVKETIGEYNIATGKTTTTATEKHLAYVIISEFENPDNDIIKISDLLIKAYVVDGFEIENNLNLKLEIGSKTYDIINSFPIAPGGVILLYKLQCRDSYAA